MTDHLTSTDHLPSIPTPTSAAAPATTSAPAPAAASWQRPADPAGPGTVVGGRYTLRSAIGHGGMGTVWRASDGQLGREVAVKEVVPPPGIAREDREAMYERMMREARAAAGLSHPGIVQVYDVVTDGGRPWVVMELLDARSMSDMVLEDGALAPRAVAKIGVALLGALEVAHAAGVLHRDVKPANVLVCADGRCVLTDFGVARMPTDQQLTTPGMVLGSPHFISPERAMGARFGPPSDLFSLGVTLYAAVEGCPPFDKGEPIATMHSVVEDEPRPPQRAGVLTQVLYGLLEKDPARRWDTATARQVLRDLLAGPLASRTPMFPTDPYAVVPSQRPPWQQDGGARSGSDQIGGRALLAPGELPGERTGHAGPGDPGYTDPGYTDPGYTDPGYTDPGYTDPGYAEAGPGYAGAGGTETGYADPYRGTPDAYGQLPDRYGSDADTAVVDGGANGYPARSRTRSASTGAVAGRAATAAGQAATAIGGAAGRGLAAVRGAPGRVQIAVVAGLAALALVGVVWAVAGGGGDPADGSPAAGGDAAPGASGDAPGEPPFEVQTYDGRGMVVNLPAQWQGVDNPELVYIDFVDPADASAQVRLLEETWNGDARGLVEVAEGNIRERSCGDTYQRVDLSDVQVAGRDGVQLEYTCDQDGAAYRAMWVTVVDDGTAYSFRFRAREDDFAERQEVFDELVRSFQLAE